MGHYTPPTSAEVRALWETQFGGMEQCAKALKGRNLRRALSTPCSQADLHEILRVLVDAHYPSDETLSAHLDRHADFCTREAAQ